MVCDTARLLNDAIRDGKTRDVRRRAGHHARYRSRHLSRSSLHPAPRPAEPAPGPGVAPTRIHGVIGVSKAYITRVGGGPFPTEALDDAGERIRKRGNEFGAVTGRPRRCGWFDVPLLRYTAMINGFDSMVVTKLDVLDQLDEIPVCVATALRQRRARRTCRPRTREIETIEPVYQMLPGWSTPTAGSRGTRSCRRKRANISTFWKRGPASKWAASPPDRSAIRPSCGPARGSRS